MKNILAFSAFIACASAFAQPTGMELVEVNGIWYGTITDLTGLDPTLPPGGMAYDIINGEWHYSESGGPFTEADPWVNPQNQIEFYMAMRLDRQDSIFRDTLAAHNTRILALTPPAPTFNYPTRSLNSAFQISATKNATVSYTVDVACTLNLSGGQTGTVTLEYADDSGFTTNVQTVQSTVNGNTGTLAIGLNMTQTTSCSLSGMIPAGKYVRIRTTNTAGTPSFTYQQAQEVY